MVRDIAVGKATQTVIALAAPFFAMMILKKNK
jgi:hypothetical protein